jgi:hypothetical protein
MSSSHGFFVGPFSAIVLASVLSMQGIQAVETPKDVAATRANMMEQCKEMQEHKRQMMIDMKAQDQALSEQVVQMNSADAGQKLGHVVAIVTRMVEQRIAMHAHMAVMGDRMMGHMMQHMQMGKESLQACPMMSGSMDGKK